MTWCSSRTPKRSESPSLRHGRKAGMGSQGHCVNMKKTWSLVLALMFLRNPTSTPVLCASVVSATTPSHVCSVGCWSTRCSGITDWLVASSNYVCPRCNGKALPMNGRSVTQVDIDGASGYGWHHAWCGGHFLLLRWHAVIWLGQWQWHCCPMLRGLGKV